MLTGLKESSLVRKCVFYRLEYTGKWGSHGTEIKFLKFKFEIYQRIKLKEQMRKMGSFVQLSLLPELWLLNVKNSSFYLLSAGYNKKSVPVWVRNLSASERSYVALSENTMDFILCSYHWQNFNVYKNRISVFLCSLRDFSDIYPQYLTKS